MRYKLFLYVFLVMMVLETKGNVIYLSSSAGSDTYTLEQARNPLTPWKTLEKLNSSMALIHPGDSILFNRGDRFIGQVHLTRSGTSEKPIVFGAFGSGDAPVISAAIPIDQWVNTGGNLWEADCSLSNVFVTNFMINGESQQIGRFPNSDAANSGYLTIESHAGDKSITSAELSAAPDMTGGDAMIRTNLWFLDKSFIQQHSGSIINVEPPAFGAVRNNFGFFIQNHLNTLDESGEWYYDEENSKIYLFYPSDPNTLKTEVSSHDACFYADGVQNVNVEDLGFYGSSLQGVFFQSADHVKLRRNMIFNSGNDGIIIRKCDYVSVENNRIVHTNNNALIVLNCKEITVKGNEIFNTGLRAGMGARPYFDPLIGIQLEYTGIFIEGNNIVCEQNILDSTGFNGIYFMGDLISVVRNYINHFCMTLEDGAGIYTYNEALTSHTDRSVEKNIILNGIGAPEGTNNPEGFSDANGIYLDYGTDHVLVNGNSIAHCVNNGIYNGLSHDNTFTSNTLYNNHTQLVLNENQREVIIPVSNCVVRDNIFFSRTNDQFLMELQSLQRSDIDRFGTFDWNYFCRPVDEFDAIRLVYMEDNSTNFVQELLDLKSWQLTSGNDLHSQGSPYQLPIFSINDEEPNKFTNGGLDTGISPWRCWSPYSNCRTSWEDSDIMDGGCMKAEFTSVSGESYGRMFITNYAGEVEAGENYVMKFSLAATQDEKNIQILMRRGVAPYDFIDTNKKFKAGSAREEYEILFVPDLSDSNARIDFLITEDNTDYRFDNFGFHKADIELTTSEDSIKFLYNPGPEPLEYHDGLFYMDARGRKYHNFTLQPYESLILIKISELLYSVNDLTAPQAGLKVFPNPTTDLIHIICSESSESQVHLYDSSGKCVYKQACAAGRMTVDASFLDEGVYFIQVIHDRGVKAGKFIKL